MSLKPSGEIKKGLLGHDAIVFYPSPSFLLPFLTTLFLSLYPRGYNSHATPFCFILSFSLALLHSSFSFLRPYLTTNKQTQPTQPPQQQPNPPSPLLWNVLLFLSNTYTPLPSAFHTPPLHSISTASHPNPPPTYNNKKSGGIHPKGNTKLHRVVVKEK